MSRLSREWQVSTSHEPIYTGGNVRATADGSVVATACTTMVRVLDGPSSVVVATVTGDGEAITTFALRADGQELIMCTESYRIRQYALPTGLELRSWAGHHGVPVLDSAYDSTGALIATGASDKLVRVWDAANGACTHNFKGHEGIIQQVGFHPDGHRLQLVSCSDDATLRVWDLNEHTCVGLFKAHVSAVTAFDFSPCGNRLVSAGRDKIVGVWNLVNMSQESVFPVHESLEAIRALPEALHVSSGEPANPKGSPKIKSRTAKIQVVVAGEKGALSMWDGNGKLLMRQQDTDAGAVQLSDLVVCPRNEGMELLAVRADQQLMVYSLGQLPVLKLSHRLVGYIDEVIDIKYANAESTQIVVASNSNEVHLLQLEDMACQLMHGHSDIVLAVDVSNDFKLVSSASKDNTVRIFDMESRRCIALGQGHTEAVGVVAWPNKSTDFLISGSKDRTLKIWKSAKLKTDVDEPVTLKVRSNTVAHEKDINTIAVAPNDALFATGSQDKTIKIWPTTGVLSNPQAVLKGHKRGVWSLAFSPVDKCLASGSGDSTIKVWSMTDYTCVKTLEGHSASVLRVGFITAGMQLLSSGGDGLFKVWTIKTNECVNTFDKHQDKIWAMAIHPNGQTVVTGASDSTINIWEDHTAQADQEAREEDEGKELQQQELSNATRSKEYGRAVQLALKLDRPYQMYLVIKSMLLEGQPGELRTLMHGLVDEDLMRLLHFVRAWNTKAKQSEVSQEVLAALYECPGSIARLQSLEGMKEVLEGLLPYTQRHVQRLSKLLRGSYFIDYVVEGMSLTPLADHGLMPTENVTEKVKTKPTKSPKKSPKLAPKSPKKSPKLTPKRALKATPKVKSSKKAKKV